MAASQISALGLNELIAESELGDINKALEFARNPEALKAIRQKLEAHRGHSPLFNTKQYVKDLESLYIGLVNQASLL